MRILMLNTYDIIGGAARSAYRLHQGLLRAGMHSEILVANKNTDDFTVLGPKTKLEKALNSARSFLDSSFLSLYGRRDRSAMFSPGLVTNAVTYRSAASSDIVHLHWTSGGFVGIGGLKRFARPIVWTLHDSWAFTGGCHVPLDCTRYVRSCGRCPILKTTGGRDLSRFILERKRKAWKNLNITVVTPSRWLARCAANSALFNQNRIEIIPNGLDLSRYRPIEKSTARELLSLPQDKKLILFGAVQGTTVKNKGFDLLLSGLKKLSEDARHKQYELIVFGSSTPSSHLNLAMDVRYLGMMHDDIAVALMYSAADVLVVPSYQENLPNTLLEASACGTPSVAFRVGGIPDLIEHEKTGYLAEPFDTSDLMRGIQFVLENSERWKSLSLSARQKAESMFPIEKTVDQYTRLYRDILKQP
jgi:glycosyltransferase involved in cell wall biosynthesis